eukprot:GHVL01009998.1.p1 GENE.GHVL01009998.1~~GHVL01009998.1.p1  ORF type:complete len:281 (-),score=50.30 GHVL01009998.1:1083-1925(-)
MDLDKKLDSSLDSLIQHKPQRKSPAKPQKRRNRPQGPYQPLRPTRRTDPKDHAILNTVWSTNNNNETIIRLLQTDVVIFKNNGDMTLTSEGHRTQETHYIINMVLKTLGMSLSGDYCDTKWQVTGAQQLWDFTDKMVIRPTGIKVPPQCRGSVVCQILSQKKKEAEIRKIKQQSQWNRTAQRGPPRQAYENDMYFDNGHGRVHDEYYGGGNGYDNGLDEYDRMPDEYGGQDGYAEEGFSEVHSHQNNIRNCQIDDRGRWMNYGPRGGERWSRQDFDRRNR